MPGEPPPVVVGLRLHLESTFTCFVGRITCWCWFAYLECMTVVSGAIFWINPPAYKYLPKLMESISFNPIPMFGDGIKYIYRICWWFIIGVNDRQQAPPHLTFASPWAKPNSVMDQELLQCFHASKVHMCSIKNSPPD